MSQILEDNTVIPSYLGFGHRGGYEDPGVQTNLSLRNGEVRKIIYPTDPKSVSGRFIEYDVDVQQRDRNGTGVTVRYANCLLGNLFGGAADVFKYTLRTDDQTQPPTNGVGVGSKVILLCINGTVTKAVIIGGLRDTGTDPDGTGRNGSDDEADGHNLYTEFNGANVSINDAGELQVMFRGKTNGDGTLDSSANPDAEGTSVLFDKDGGLKMFTPNEDQSLFIDHANKKIVQVADSEWDVTVNNGPMNFTIAKDINMTSNGGQMSINVPNNVKIQSSGVLVGAATDKWVKGTTYRQGESTMNQNLISAFTQLATQIGIAAAALTAAGAVPVWPIAMVAVATAGTALVACEGPLATIISALTTFEAQAPTYLSSKNFTD